MILLQNRLNQYTVELATQSLSCPAILLANRKLSLEMIGQRLNDFVRLHHLDLLRQVNYHISKLRDTVRDKELLEESSLYPITIEQVRRIYGFLESFALRFDSSKKSSVV